MINLFTTIDESWLPYACMMLESVRRTTDDRVSCWILHENIGQSFANRVCRWAEERDVSVWFVHLDSLRINLPVAPMGTSASFWGRYIVSHVVAPSISRCIYLDVDIIAVKPIDGLMSVALEGKPFGAVVCPAQQAAREAGIPESQFINNGLLVIDVHRFPGETYIERMRETLEKRELIFGPQSAFNMATGGDAAVIEPKWNVQGEHRSEWSREAHLIHFTGDVKPWHYLSSDPLRGLVRDIILATPFPEAWEPDRTAVKIIYRMLRNFRNKHRGTIVASES